MIRAAVVGATGYAGVQLAGLLSSHPEVGSLMLVSRSHGGERLAELYPALYGSALGEQRLQSLEPEEVPDDLDVLFTAVPAGAAMPWVEPLSAKEIPLIDLGADFRLSDADRYGSWYGRVHEHPGALEEAVYGLTEINAGQIRGAKLVANPGCYPTAALLPLWPLLHEGFIRSSGIVIDAKSGVTGAGRLPRQDLHFPEVGENFKGYNLSGTHRHTPEIEQELTTAAGDPVRVSFNPHLLPINRGILATIYARPVSADEGAGEEAFELLGKFYRDAPFVTVLPPGEWPQTRSVYGTNRCQLGVHWDPRTERLLLISVIDNLVKGAAGQAVQNFNLVLGFEETAGLEGGTLVP